MPALKAGTVDKARASVRAFKDGWPRVEGLIRMRSPEAADAVAQNLAALEKALMAASPDIEAVNGLITKVTLPYNGVVAQLTRDARATVAK